MYRTGDTALTVRIPAAEPVVGRWRAAHDPSAAYGVPPHVTVLYPFLPPDRVDVDELRRLFAEHEPFDLRFERTARLPGLLYLAPEPDGPLRELTDAVAARWPEAPPYRNAHPGDVPHLTVATSALDEVEDGLTGLPVTWRVGGVTLSAFDGRSWRDTAYFPLGRPPEAEFGFPGELRDRLVAAILSGEKTATSSLLLEYEKEGEPLPSAGEWSVLVDSAGRRIALLETSEVRVVPLRDVDDRFARDEGEGFADTAEWRAAHVAFWTSPGMVAALGERPLIDDDTPVVAERFRLLDRW
ncbi:2'-5' RNA ligase family protein [Nonomuraea longicatena]|uniref:ASCH domain-containing protein n=1 Tax=Nonomuraea longicatena TaxID=83682 RepID=A0ABN1NSX3_9ACTN